jgi:hypothetical protein
MKTELQEPVLWLVGKPSQRQDKFLVTSQTLLVKDYDLTWTVVSPFVLRAMTILLSWPASECL